MRTFFFSFFLGIFVSCNSQDNRLVADINIEMNEDSGFLQESEIPVGVRLAYIDKHVEWTEIISNRMMVSGIQGDKSMYIFIKEYGLDKIHRHLIHCNDRQLYGIPTYDSLEYDNLNTVYYDSDVTFSKSFYNLAKIRGKDTTFQKKFDTADDMTELERIVNTLDIFKQLDLKNKLQVKTLKRLFMLTQMDVLTYSQNGFGSVGNVEIQSQVDINSLKMKTDTSLYRHFPGGIVYPNKVYKYWSEKNFEFIQSKIPEIEKDYQKENVFYFYSIPDFKLFRFEVNVDEEGYIHLSKEHLNKEYLWFDVDNAIPVGRGF